MIHVDKKTKERTDIGKAVKDLLAEQRRAGRTFEVRYRDADAHSLVVDLLRTKV